MPLTIGAVGAPIIGGLIGSSEASKDRKRADKARQRALEQYLGIELPDLKSQELDLATGQYLGDYNAAQEQFQELGPSEMENISVDPRLAQEQMKSLEQLGEIGEGNMSEGNKAAIEQIRRGAAGEAQAKQAQIMNQMQARGQGGSGAELIARLQAAQSGADRASQQGMDVVRMNEDKALQAILNKGSLAGQMSQQSFSQQAQQKGAQDAINRFNQAQQQSLTARNIGSQNEAALRNLQEQQRLAEQAAAVGNQEQIHNRGLIQTGFSNEMDLAKAKANAYTGQAAGHTRDAANVADQWSTIGQGVGKGLAGMYKADDKE